MENQSRMKVHSENGDTQVARYPLLHFSMRFVFAVFTFRLFLLSASISTREDSAVPWNTTGSPSLPSTTITYQLGKHDRDGGGNESSASKGTAYSIPGAATRANGPASLRAAASVSGYGQPTTTNKATASHPTMEKSPIESLMMMDDNKTGRLRDVAHGRELRLTDRLEALVRNIASIENERKVTIVKHGEKAYLGILIEWHVKVLECLLERVVSNRRNSASGRVAAGLASEASPRRRLVIDEVTESVQLLGSYHSGQSSIPLDPKVVVELRNFVIAVAQLYRHENPFHNFEHATHVTMSVVNFLRDIVSQAEEPTSSDLTTTIASDPVALVACAFSGLIHDAEHQGVTNSQLSQENTTVARMYEHRSIAEQNSVHVAWRLLEQTEYARLGAAMFGEDAEDKQRIRQLVINLVMATDIMDKNATQWRRKRWDRLFAAGSKDQQDRSTLERRAMLVMEHILQASDVAHTMQDWQSYSTWNARLIQEQAVAYRHGRGAVDPSENWREGELGFFDFYIVPLAQRLKTSGAFEDADRYLAAALSNRQEWEDVGHARVGELMRISDRKDGPA